MHRTAYLKSTRFLFFGRVVANEHPLIRVLASEPVERRHVTSRICGHWLQETTSIWKPSVLLSKIGMQSACHLSRTSRVFHMYLGEDQGRLIPISAAFQLYVS
jgi:hypothetical protein